MKGFARSFAIAGAKGIVLVARSLTQLQEAAEELGKEFPKTQFLPLACDIRSDTSVKAMFEQIRATFGTADVLVNNAGGTTDGKPLRSASIAAVWEPFVRINKIYIYIGSMDANASLGNQLEGLPHHGPRISQPHWYFPRGHCYQCLFRNGFHRHARNDQL